MKRGMSLYVWYGVFGDYTDGIAFALAASKEDAIQEIARGQGRQADMVIETLEQLEPEVYTGAMGHMLRGGM